MPIIAKRTGGDFQPAPAGQWPARCCDVADLGMVETAWGVKHKIRVYWVIPPLMDDGRPFIVAKQYTLSLHPKAILCIDLESWRGHPFTDAEALAFDVESMLNTTALLQITHHVKEDSTYANVTALMALPAGMEAPPLDPDYVRWQDKEGHAPAQAKPSNGGQQNDASDIFAPMPIVPKLTDNGVPLDLNSMPISQLDIDGLERSLRDMGKQAMDERDSARREQVRMDLVSISEWINANGRDCNPNTVKMLEWIRAQKDWPTLPMPVAEPVADEPPF